MDIVDLDIEALPVVGRDVICASCGHLVYVHKHGRRCEEAIPHGGGQTWPCDCPRFAPLDPSAA